MLQFATACLSGLFLAPSATPLDPALAAIRASERAMVAAFLAANLPTSRPSSLTFDLISLPHDIVQQSYSINLAHPHPSSPVDLSHLSYKIASYLAPLAPAPPLPGVYFKLKLHQYTPPSDRVIFSTDNFSLCAIALPPPPPLAALSHTTESFPPNTLIFINPPTSNLHLVTSPHPGPHPQHSLPKILSLIADLLPHHPPSLIATLVKVHPRVVQEAQATLARTAESHRLSAASRAATRFSLVLVPLKL